MLASMFVAGGATAPGWFEVAVRATRPWASYTREVASPTLPLPRVVAASRHTHSPAGGRSTWTVSSVLRNPHSAGSSSAETPEAESTHDSSRWTGDIGSPSTRSTAVGFE